MPSDIKLGVYRHYKGKHYLVIGVAKHSETLEDMVVYVDLYENDKSQLWVRPLELFLGEVEIDGNVQPRFTFVGAQSSSGK